MASSTPEHYAACGADPLPGAGEPATLAATISGSSGRPSRATTRFERKRERHRRVRLAPFRRHLRRSRGGSPQRARIRSSRTTTISTTRSRRLRDPVPAHRRPRAGGGCTWRAGRARASTSTSTTPIGTSRPTTTACSGTRRTTCDADTVDAPHLSACARRSVGGGPAAEHNYTTGLMLHYFLTGDALSSRGRRSVSAQFVIDMDDGRKTIFRWLDRAPTRGWRLHRARRTTTGRAGDPANSPERAGRRPSPDRR